MELLTTIYIMTFLVLCLQIAVFIILFKGSSRESSIKKRVAMKKLQLEEIMLEKQIRSSGMPTIEELIRGGQLESVPIDEKDKDGEAKDPKNRSKIGF